MTDHRTTSITTSITASILAGLIGTIFIAPTTDARGAESALGTKKNPHCFAQENVLGTNLEIQIIANNNQQAKLAYQNAIKSS